MRISITRRQVARGAVAVAAIGLGFLIMKGAILFSLLLMAKAMVNLMAYPAVIMTLSNIMAGLLQYQTALAAILGPICVGIPLFRTFAPAANDPVNPPPTELARSMVVSEQDTSIPEPENALRVNPSITPSLESQQTTDPLPPVSSTLSPSQDAEEYRMTSRC